MSTVSTRLKISRNEMSTLYEAVVHGDYAAVKKLVTQNCVDLNVSHLRVKWTVLHAASHGGHVQIIRTLLKHGASPHSKDSAGWTAADIAQREGHRECVQLLQAHGDEEEKEEKEDDEGNGEDEGKKEGEEEVEDEVEEASDPAKEVVAKSPLKKRHFMLSPLPAREPVNPGDKIKVAELLLEKGADADCVDMTGRCALDYAAQLLRNLPQELAYVQRIFLNHSHGAAARRHRQGSSNPKPTEEASGLATPASPVSLSGTSSAEEPLSPMSGGSVASSDMDAMMTQRRERFLAKKVAAEVREQKARAAAAAEERKRREQEAKENRSLALALAVETGDEAKAAALLRRFPDDLNANLCPFQSEQTLLHISAFHGRRGCCALLLTAGADINARDYCGRSALAVALRSTLA
jgi:ankyrin repeat protein